MPGWEEPRFPVTFDGQVVHVGTANELAVVLDVLQGKHDRLVLEQLEPHLARVIATPRGLIATLKSLAAEDQLLAIDILGQQLAEMVPSATALRDLLAVLAEPAVEERVLLTLGSAALRRTVRTADHLAEVLEWIYGRNDGLLLELLGAEHLRRLLDNASGLSRVLHSLDRDRQDWLLRQVGLEAALSLVRSGPDLTYLLRAMPPDLSDSFLAGLDRKTILAVVGNEDNWADLCRRLEPAELSHLCSKLGVDADA